MLLIWSNENGYLAIESKVSLVVINQIIIFVFLQVLQQDIESHSKIVSAVLKLCEHLQADKKEPKKGEKVKEAGCDSLQTIAVHLERRWHAIWLQSLEWQCRLEEAITRGKVSLNK